MVAGILRESLGHSADRAAILVDIIPTKLVK